MSTRPRPLQGVIRRVLTGYTSGSPWKKILRSTSGRSHLGLNDFFRFFLNASFSTLLFFAAVALARAKERDQQTYIFDFRSGPIYLWNDDKTDGTLTYSGAIPRVGLLLKINLGDGSRAG